MCAGVSGPGKGWGSGSQAFRWGCSPRDVCPQVSPDHFLAQLAAPGAKTALAATYKPILTPAVARPSALDLETDSLVRGCQRRKSSLRARPLARSLTGSEHYGVAFGPRNRFSCLRDRRKPVQTFGLKVGSRSRQQAHPRIQQRHFYESPFPVNLTTCYRTSE
jgi:hypothetical protein